MTPLALGGPAPWARAGPADLTPLVAMVAAVLILRFVVGVRLTVMTATLAVCAGALWASIIERWGVALPSAAAAVLLTGLRTAVGRARSA
ncbi:MAG: hypothetical protein ACRD29_23165 [Acidimicrobiales bacterium]